MLAGIVSRAVDIVERAVLRRDVEPRHLHLQRLARVVVAAELQFLGADDFETVAECRELLRCGFLEALADDIELFGRACGWLRRALRERAGSAQSERNSGGERSPMAVVHGVLPGDLELLKPYGRPRLANEGGERTVSSRKTCS